MQHRIEHLLEPQRLYLAWQAPDHLGDRVRWAVGVVERNDAVCSLRYFQSDREFEAVNQGRSVEDLRPLGFAGYPGFAWKDRVYTDGVLEAFLRRIPPRDRSDFSAYLEQFRLPDDRQISDFALLAYTGAKLPSDGFSLVDPLDADAETCDLLIEIAGFRYYGGELQPGDPVRFEREPENNKDPQAVAVLQANNDGYRVGYVNRLKAPTFARWLENRQVSGVIERLNGNPERPRAFVFVTVRPLNRAAAA